MRAMMKIWVSGASGQVGTAITDVADPLAFELLNTDVEELDITEIDEVLNFAELNRPDVIINCAGITDVALCEKNPELAYKVNALGARNLSIAARKIGAKLVQISTDDVFDGQSSEPYCEFDDTNPKTVYGRSKRAGENYVKEFTEKAFYYSKQLDLWKRQKFCEQSIGARKDRACASGCIRSVWFADKCQRSRKIVIGTYGYQRIWHLPYYGEGNLQPVRVCKRDSEVDRS